MTDLDVACDALATGRAVVVPNPSPMTYGVVGRDPSAVNVLKRRPPDQNVAVALHDPQTQQEVLSLLDGAAGRVVAALLRRRYSVLVPLRADAPAWLAPAVRDGRLAAFDPRWTPTEPLWEHFPILFGSSANRTGTPPAATADEARAIFGDAAPVIDADMLRDPTVAHAASTMIAVDHAGAVTLHRSGAQDAFSGLPAADFLAQLSAAVTASGT